MKYFTLILLYVLVTSLEAQNNYVPLKKARKSTEFILIKGAYQITRWMKRSEKYPSCKALKADVRGMASGDISVFLQFIATSKNIDAFHLQYNQADSIDYKFLGQLTGLQELRLQNSEMGYEQIAMLGNLKNLDKLGLYINNIKQLPLEVCWLSSLSELELMADTFNPLNSSQLPLYYRLNDTLDNFIEIISNAEAIDLTADSVKQFLLASLPGSQEKKSSLNNYWGYSPVSMIKKAPSEFTYKPNTNLKPLFKDEPAKFETALISPEIANELVFDDGTFINIPKDAFVTLSGQVVVGDIKVMYRSIRTPAEIMASGITMFYDTAGQKEMFKTNGMFEIRAYAGKEELKLKEDKNIEVNFATEKDSSNFNFYTLNEQTGKWEYNSALTWTAPRYNLLDFYKLKDETAFAERYNSSSYHYLLPNGISSNVNVPTLSRREMYKRTYVVMGQKCFNCTSKEEKMEHNRKIKYGKPLLRLRIDYSQSDSKAKKIKFYLLNSNYHSDERVRSNYFPELRFFDGYAFEYDGEMLVNEFSKQFKKGKCYTDCRILYEAKDNSMVIELKTTDGFVQIPVKTTITLPNGKVKANHYLRRAYTKYCLALGIKEDKFNKALNRRYYNVGYRYYDTLLYKKRGSGASGKNAGAYYKMNIKMLGFFNCDQIYRIEQPMIVKNSKFIREGDTLIEEDLTAYVVDTKANGTYTFPAEEMTLSYPNISGIILCNNNGEVYTCKGDDFRNQVGSSSNVTGATIKVQKMPKVDKAEEVVNKLNR